jgi:hypothetical protein
VVQVSFVSIPYSAKMRGINLSKLSKIFSGLGFRV